MHFTENGRNCFQWILEAGVIVLSAPHVITALNFPLCLFSSCLPAPSCFNDMFVEGQSEYLELHDCKAVL